MNSHHQGSFGRSFQTNSPSKLPIHPASTPWMSFLISVQKLHDTQFLSYLLKSKALCMKDCWREQGFQCFAVGTIWAASVLCIISLTPPPKTPKQHSYILLKNNPLNILCSILNTWVSLDLWAVKGPSNSPKLKTACFLYSTCLMPNRQSCPGVSEP